MRGRQAVPLQRLPLPTDSGQSYHPWTRGMPGLSSEESARL